MRLPQPQGPVQDHSIPFRGTKTCFLVSRSQTQHSITIKLNKVILKQNNNQEDYLKFFLKEQMILFSNHYSVQNTVLNPAENLKMDKTKISPVLRFVRDVVKILIPTKPLAPAHCSLLPTLEDDAWVRLIFDAPCFIKGEVPQYHPSC